MNIHSKKFRLELKQFCLQYLDAQHSTLWSQSWNIYEADGRQQAADWLAATMIEVLDVAQQGPSTPG